MSCGLNIHTIEIQDEIINYLRKDNERLRELLKGVVDDMTIGDEWEYLLKLIENEVSNESK